MADTQPKVGESPQTLDIQAGSIRVAIPGDPISESAVQADDSKDQISTKQDHLARVVVEHHHNGVDSDRINAQDIQDLHQTKLIVIGPADSATIRNPKNPIDGDRLMYRIKQNTSGTKSVSWDTDFRGSTALPLPTLTATANTVDYFGFQYNGFAKKWDFLAQVKGFAS